MGWIGEAPIQGGAVHCLCLYNSRVKITQETSCSESLNLKLIFFPHVPAPNSSLFFLDVSVCKTLIRRSQLAVRDKRHDICIVYPACSKEPPPLEVLE